MQVLRDAPLGPRTTIGVGGPAQRLVVCERDAELIEVVREAERDGSELFVLGGGSNVVVADEGWPGIVVQPKLPGVSLQRDGDSALVRVGAGVLWDDVVAEVVDAGLAGIEALAGIPGWAGATPVQNVGAYGAEVAQTIEQVVAYDRSAREVVELSADACEFAYRDSLFKRTRRHVVLEVSFRLRFAALGVIRYAELARALGVAIGARAPLGHIREAVIALRRAKGMVVDEGDGDSRSCGSFFVNPVVGDAEFARIVERARSLGLIAASETPPQYPAGEGARKLPAAWLIERAGVAKGFRRGNAGVSSKHTLALVNLGGATAREVLELADYVRAAVHGRFGVTLIVEPEVVRAGGATGRRELARPQG